MGERAASTLLNVTAVLSLPSCCKIIRVGSCEPLCLLREMLAERIELQLSFPEMFEGTSELYPQIRRPRQLVFLPLSISCHRTNSPCLREGDGDLPVIHDLLTGDRSP